jgi:hypothetical protein
MTTIRDLVAAVRDRIDPAGLIDRADVERAVRDLRDEPYEAYRDRSAALDALCEAVLARLLGEEDEEDEEDGAGRPAPIAARIPESAEIGESAEEWWDALSYEAGEYGGYSHPICGWDEIDTYDPESRRLPRWSRQILSEIPRSELDEDAREAYRDLVEYGRQARADALAIREHLDAAITAAREGDAVAMAEELDRASSRELEYGDDPSTQTVARALLGEGWVVAGGVLRYDPDQAGRMVGRLVY